MRTHPTTAWIVSYRNVNGVERRHTFFTKWHAEGFARAMQHPSAGVTEVKIIEFNSFNQEELIP
jgi:hypothetical protein